MKPLYDRIWVTCPICKSEIKYSYQNYLELLKFLREEVFLQRPDFYNKRAHGRTVKWYWYNLSRGVIPNHEQDNNSLFIKRVENSIRRKFPYFYRRVNIKLVSDSDRHHHLKAVIVSFKYHGEFQDE